MRHDERALAEWLRERVQAWQRLTAHIVLVRCLGAATARRVCEQALGSSGTSLLRATQHLWDGLGARFDRAQVWALRETLVRLLGDPALLGQDLPLRLLAAVPRSI